MENQPTAHRARARWRTWRRCLRGQRGPRSTPRRWPRLFFTDTAPGRRLRLQSVVIDNFTFRGARLTRASPRGEPADSPQSTCALADLASLSSRPTQGTLHPTLLAEAFLHRHRARLAATASECRNRSLQIRWRAARARFVPWRTIRPPTEHVIAGGLGVVVLAANADRTASHAIGQGSTSTQPRQVGGCGFEPSWLKLPNPESRGPRALRPVENPPTAHRANALANLAWLYSQPTRSTLHPTPLAEAPLQHNLARSVAVASNIHGYSFRIPCRAARARFAPWRTHRPPTEHARAGGLGVVVFAANAGRAPPHAVGRGSSSPTPRQVGGCGFGLSYPKLSSSVARGPHALRPVENQPTAHRARARWRTWRRCLCGQHGARSTSRRWPRLFFTDTAPGRRPRLRSAAIDNSEFRNVRPTRASSRGEPADRTQSTCTLAHLASLFSRLTQGTLHPTPLAEGLLH